MHNMGMIIGSHGFSHNLLSKLKRSKKKKFIILKRYSKISLKKKINFFCYPYGGAKSYNNNTVKILKKVDTNFLLM